MVYTVGISSGIWIKGAQDSPNYAGITRKMYASIRYGVQFVQLDIQHLTEFLEPGLKENMEKLLKGGYSYGIHGETSSYGAPVHFDSSMSNDYKITHEKVIRHIEEAAKYGAKYVLFHSSESTPLPLALQGGALKEMNIVDPWGGRFDTFLEKYPKLLDWATDNSFIKDYILSHFRIGEVEDYIESKKREFVENNKKNPTEDDIKTMRNEISKNLKEQKKKVIKEFVVGGSTFYLPDRISYPIIAKWMEMEDHPLWKKFVGKKTFEEIENKMEEWVPAVTAMYTAGHFDSKCTLAPIKKLSEEKKMLIVFETPMPPESGYESYMRLAKLTQIYKMIDYINSDYIGMAVDFEHLITSNIDPKAEIAALPPDAGKKIRVIHAGAPVAYATAHMAVEIGSDDQKYIYDRMWELRQKGFKDGYVIYERAGEEGIKTSILALRLIVQFLEQNVPPKDLPLEFFGLKELGPEIKRQELTIRQHMLDPLKGMLVVSEEEHGFFGTSAHKKGKAKEWGEEEYR